MLNILIPMAGKGTFSVSEKNAYPKILSDIEGELLVERAASSFVSIKADKRIIVTIPEQKINDYKLNNVFSLLDKTIEVLPISGETQGAACSCLLAVEQLDLDSPLIISSFEQVLDFELDPYLDIFIEKKVDAGVLTFDSIHPKWSYVNTDECGYVTQAAEKNPISKHAIAGFYFYRTARLFIEAIKSMIRNDVRHNNLFYVSPTLNEIILKEGKVLALPIEKENYFHIQDEHALEAYEDRVMTERENSSASVLQRTKEYISAFDSKSLIEVDNFFSIDFHLTDPDVSIKGKQNVLDYIGGIFNNVSSLSFEAKSIVVENKTSVIEFILKVDGVKLIGTDVIRWNENGKMISMNAYLYESK
ncbi:nuclear transport factor 2 family protein [Colwelliaceae bacterium MEBiC 14330]